MKALYILGDYLMLFRAAKESSQNYLHHPMALLKGEEATGCYLNSYLRG